MSGFRVYNVEYRAPSFTRPAAISFSASSGDGWDIAGQKEYWAAANIERDHARLQSALRKGVRVGAKPSIETIRAAIRAELARQEDGPGGWTPYLYGEDGAMISIDGRVDLDALARAVQALT